MQLTKQQLTAFLFEMLTEENFQQVNHDGRFGRRKNIYYLTQEECFEIEQEVISKCMQVITILRRRNYVNQVLHGKASQPYIVYGITVYSINKKLAFKAFNGILKGFGLERPNTEDMSTSFT